MTSGAGSQGAEGTEGQGRTEVVVGRLGRPHGVQGEASVEPRTDEPDRRFAPGTVLRLRTVAGLPPPRGRPVTLTVRSTRWHQQRLLVTFAELADRTATEAVRGLLLVASVAAEETPEDPEEFYDHQLVGLDVVTTQGDPVGRVAEVLHSGGQDLLAVETFGGEVLVPFVTALVPVVDLSAGRVVVEDRPGLLGPLPGEP